MNRYAKETNTPVFLIGHITKDGSIAGLRFSNILLILFLQFEGESQSCLSYFTRHKKPILVLHQSLAFLKCRNRIERSFHLRKYYFHSTMKSEWYMPLLHNRGLRPMLIENRHGKFCSLWYPSAFSHRFRSEAIKHVACRSRKKMWF